MRTYTVELPESLHKAAGEFAEGSGLSVDQLLASALSEKVSALAGPGWLERRAARADRDCFESALSEVADIEPDEHDRI